MILTTFNLLLKLKIMYKDIFITCQPFLLTLLSPDVRSASNVMYSLQHCIYSILHHFSSAQSAGAHMCALCLTKNSPVLSDSPFTFRVSIIA